jgi:hypothetical protein
VPSDRSKFLVKLAQRLATEAVLGDGSVARAIVSTQREFFRPPTDAETKPPHFSFRDMGEPIK